MPPAGSAMIHSSHRDRKTKAVAEVLAMIPVVHHELMPHRPRPVRETDEWLWKSATEFCAAMDRYAERAMDIIERESTASSRANAAAPPYKGIPRHSRGIPLHSNESIS
jgi:hypothetical protein